MALIGRACDGLFGGDSLNGTLVVSIGAPRRQLLVVLLLDAPERHATAAKDLPDGLGVQALEVTDLGRPLVGRGVAQLLLDVREGGRVMAVDLRRPCRRNVAGRRARPPPVRPGCSETALLIAAGTRGIFAVGD